MSMSLIILMINVAFFYILTLVYISKNRKEITSMVGMMTAMTLGMLIGLLGGTIVGVHFAENLFLSTVVGGGIGFLSGAIVGIPLNLLTTLEGMLSGLMAGMMGAMLGAMISSSYIDAIIKILFLMEFLFNLIILYLLMNERKDKKESIGEKCFKNPVLMSLSMGLFFYLFNMAGPITFSGSLNEQSSHENHNAQGKIKQNETDKITLEISADDFTYSPADIQLEKARKVTINFENTGQVEHDLQLDGLNAEILEAESHHSEEKEGIHIHAKPGDKSSITFKPLESGTFEFYCTLPGHKESGMVGSLRVL
jgi:uncharacterized cupredoxin-like copper-binding protein